MQEMICAGQGGDYLNTAFAVFQTDPAMRSTMGTLRQWIG
jgi:hypothetical protein